MLSLTAFLLQVCVLQRWPERVLRKVTSVFLVDTENWNEIPTLDQRKRIHAFCERFPSPFSRFEHSLMNLWAYEIPEFDHKSCVKYRTTFLQQDLHMQKVGSQGNLQMLSHRQRATQQTLPPTLCLYKSGRFQDLLLWTFEPTDGTRLYLSYKGQGSNNYQKIMWLLHFHWILQALFSFSVISKLPVLLFVYLRAFIKLHMHCNTEIVNLNIRAAASWLTGLRYTAWKLWKMYH